MSRCWACLRCSPSVSVHYDQDGPLHDRGFIARPPEQVLEARIVDQRRSPDPFNKRPEVLGEAPPGLDVHLHEFAKIAVLRRLGAAVGDLPDVVRTILEDADRAIFSPRLVKAFMKIPRPAVRHRLVALVREIAGDDGE